MNLWLDRLAMFFLGLLIVLLACVAAFCGQLCLVLAVAGAEIGLGATFVIVCLLGAVLCLVGLVRGLWALGYAIRAAWRWL